MTESLLVSYPLLARQWHPAKNGDLTPDKVTAGSGRRVWWMGSCGHEWEARVDAIIASKSGGCPYCSGKKALTGFNDLATLYPEIAMQWHPTKNGDLKPENVRPGAANKVWWKCNKGHEWEAVCNDRTGKKHTGCPYCSNVKLLKGFNNLTETNPFLIKEWHPTKNGRLKPEDVFAGASKKVWWKCEKGHEWTAKCSDRNAGYGCPSCVSPVSKSETEIADFIKIALPDYAVKISDRSIVSPYELDIYIPEKKLAIEYNGLYWHSEAKGKDRNYHYNKWLACKEKGIQLIQIFEDDYNRNPELVKHMLAHKLGISQQEKVYARKTVVKVLTKTESDEFLNDNHIQGAVDAKLKYGLFAEEELVAVILLKNEAGTQGETLNLMRYATSKNVVGGFTKLLSHVEKDNPNAKNIVTFSDNTVSDGGLYINNGFIEAGIIKPDYMYIVSGVRTHKFGYRLKRFKNDPDLIWVEGYTESQLAKANKLLRIWDAGKVKYSKPINR